jgi:hypothetical protein
MVGGFYEIPIRREDGLASPIALDILDRKNLRREDSFCPKVYLTSV